MLALVLARIVTWAFSGIPFGHTLDWAVIILDMQAIYINSVTSALIVFIFAFLANVQERRTDYIYRSFASIFEVDSSVELKLRVLSGDNTSNPRVVIPGPEAGKFQRAIIYFADLAGIGVICSNEITAVLGGVTILGLLAGDTAMKWSTSCQLLCNIPPGRC
ncbi:868c2c66-5d20-4848-8cf7-cd52e0aea838 [Thermothielavioides terrestris]|uniref:Uncharacterized protein n=2 Tax=Thermothielavioides terrestris TaxID=2587410 RepID=G2R1A7_THETT|nr:uncharacterized protein THITE_112018 [Thermothielavioides terrestris NRRL 8126]AEO64842.1 hypothetical protein THITE_112018 [Thermothielavioides terrestris NRRL 8126]SPQ19904.1 868c2c66-5d20-4848-8cf7-cd52e0aea838 [Thermothielavioides terrestris]